MAGNYHDKFFYRKIFSLFYMVAKCLILKYLIRLDEINRPLIQAIKRRALIVN